MASYSPPKNIVSVFNLDDYTTDNDLPLTTYEADQKYIIKQGDIVVGSILFNGANTYSGVSTFCQNIKLSDSSLEIIDEDNNLN